MRCHGISRVDSVWAARLTAQEQATGFSVRGDALEQREGIADAVRSGSGQLRRVEQRVDGYDFLKERRHDT